MCPEPSFEMGFKCRVSGAPPYCNWHVVPELTTLSWQHRLTKCGTSVKNHTVSSCGGSGHSPATIGRFQLNIFTSWRWSKSTEDLIYRTGKFKLFEIFKTKEVMFLKYVAVVKRKQFSIKDFYGFLKKRFFWFEGCCICKWQVCKTVFNMRKNQNILVSVGIE